MSKCGLSPFDNENLAPKYASNMSTFLTFAANAVSTLVCAALRAADTSVFLGTEGSMKSSPLSSLSRAKNLSSIEATSTPDTDTLVEVAITYFWFTRRSGTPLILYGPILEKLYNIKIKWVF